MALIIPGTTIAAASGSIGGTVFSRNRGGMYIRNRSAVVNPNSEAQQAVRGLVGELTARWTTTLTEAQRDAWTAYAEAVPYINALGESRNMSGVNRFVQTNVIRRLCGGTTLDVAPTNMSSGPSLTPTATVTASTGAVSVTAIAGYTATASNAYIIIQGCNGRNPGVNFFKGPFYSIRAGVWVTGTVPPFAGTLRAPTAVGNAVWLRLRMVTPDGRVSPPTITRFLAS